MSVFTRLHGGGYVYPGLQQRHRCHDGVRGVFSRRHIPMGTLLMQIPSCYCCFTRDGDFVSRGGSTVMLHRSAAFSMLSRKTENRTLEENFKNHHCIFRHPPLRLLPEFNTWQRHFLYQRHMNNLWEGGKEFVKPLGLQASASDDRGHVTAITLSSCEAALSICVALRYFFSKIVPLKSPLVSSSASSFSSKTRKDSLLTAFASMSRLSAGALYVNSLPLDTLMHQGVESFFGRFAESESPYHVCLEQLAWNLRDDVLQRANNAEYAVLDQHPSSFDDVMLLSLYAVRSRIVPIRWIQPDGSREKDVIVEALVPGVDALNHSDTNPCAAVVASPVAQAVVVRATRPIAPREEITISYRSLDEEARHDDRIQWRYLMG